jgi:predicted nucleic acid-binding protein
MTLVDTSIWVDHLRRVNQTLTELLEAGSVLVHPFVIGEIALGKVRQRQIVLRHLTDLPQVCVATDIEVLHFIERYSLFGRGIGFVDVHLLAAVQLTPGAQLWTGDRRLETVAFQLGLAQSVQDSH